MLVVTRKVGERIVIGDNITVTVVRIAGGLVRIGVDAPSNCPVVRRELLDRAGAPVVDVPGHEAPLSEPSEGSPPRRES